MPLARTKFQESDNAIQVTKDRILNTPKFSHHWCLRKSLPIVRKTSQTVELGNEKGNTTYYIWHRRHGTGNNPEQALEKQHPP
jgi:hypothetical protein